MQANKIFLETKRLILYVPTSRSVDQIHELYQDKEVMRYIHSINISKQQIIALIKSLQQLYHRTGFSVGPIYQKKIILLLDAQGYFLLNQMK